MTDEMQESPKPVQASQMLLEQIVTGSRRGSNYLVGSMVSIGGIGFLLASLSSYLGKDLLPLGHPGSFIFVPQGLIMGIYGVIAFLLAIYLWSLVLVDFGAGCNLFDKELGTLSISRRALLKQINVQIPLKDVKAVKLEVREGLNPRRRIALRIQGRRDLPLSAVGQPPSLAELEKEGAELARFLNVNLEGI
ncbi:photosystem I assembly protein Ycf4 [Prochlorococcus sp. MIT 1307]|uniref:photosystem I assembly protein Ycf4 n=1 Tax=Prochlorococcus sp. MIT 1307 TaxID=3096219 RepID=UPI002A748E41|nr:photosystem I assembly protein Ycf4 [Prochlorococcus sp. MIT 1307]